jgi:hypothetical protein
MTFPKAEDYIPSADDPPARNTAKSHHKDKEESKTILMMMCYGLSNDEEERKLGDLQDESYASLNIKKMFTPTMKQLKLEIFRHAAAQRVKALVPTTQRRNTTSGSLSILLLIL